MKLLRLFSLILVLSLVRPPAFAAQGSIESAITTVKQTVAAGITPIAVFDLDETLLYTHDRKLKSYQETLPALASRYPGEVTAAQALTLSNFFSLKNAYDPVMLFEQLGIRTPGFAEAALNQAFPVYLSAKFMDLDTPITCAVHFVNQIRNAGSHIVFVSSRLHSKQYSATLESLQQLGFIDCADEWDDTETVLRPDGMSSIDFKQLAFRHIREATMIAGRAALPLLAFENEPENIEAMEKAFPHAELYFVEGAFLKAGPIPTKAHLIQDFCN